MRVQNDPCADGRTTTETDWLVIILALAAVIYSGAHYIGYEFQYIRHFLHFASSLRKIALRQHHWRNSSTPRPRPHTLYPRRPRHHTPPRPRMQKRHILFLSPFLVWERCRPSGRVYIRDKMDEPAVRCG
jgi:hypothetical protein